MVVLAKNGWYFIPSIGDEESVTVREKSIDSETDKLPDMPTFAWTPSLGCNKKTERQKNNGQSFFHFVGKNTFDTG